MLVCSFFPLPPPTLQDLLPSESLNSTVTCMTIVESFSIFVFIVIKYETDDYQFDVNGLIVR